MNAESSLPAKTKRELETAVAETIAYRAFTCKSELTKERIIKLLLSMNGGNLENEHCVIQPQPQQDEEC